jgi:hypothetical protein
MPKILSLQDLLGGLPSDRGLMTADDQPCRRIPEQESGHCPHGCSSIGPNGVGNHHWEADEGDDQPEGVRRGLVMEMLTSRLSRTRTGLPAERAVDRR